MKISKKELKRIIKEEMGVVLNEGLHYEGLMEVLMDALNGELGSWQPEAKAEVYDELTSKGLDLTQAALNIFDDDAGRHPGGSIGEGRDEIEGSEMEKHIQSLTKRVFELEKALKSMRGEV